MIPADGLRRRPATAESDPSGPALAVVVSGPAGSGKTTFAGALARRARYALFDLDVVVGPLTDAALGLLGSGADGVDAELGARLRPARYESLVAAAADNRAVGLGVVLAAPLTVERADPAAWAEMAKRLAGRDGGRVVLIYLDCPPELLARRVAGRDAARDRRKISGGRPAVRSGAPFSPHVRVDGSLDSDGQLASVADALGLPVLLPRPPDSHVVAPPRPPAAGPGPVRAETTRC